MISIGLYVIRKTKKFKLFHDDVFRCTGRRKADVEALFSGGCNMTGHTQDLLAGVGGLWNEVEELIQYAETNCLGSYLKRTLLRGPWMKSQWVHKEQDCSICLGEFEGSHEFVWASSFVWVYMLDSCNHIFHLTCLQDYLASESACAPLCPICREQIGAEEKGRIVRGILNYFQFSISSFL